MVRKTVTLVFCDVADSTPLGERLDPEALRGVWSRYHDTARAVLERHGGTIEKFVGDAVLGAFGIPLVHEDDALRAVRAAAELRDELEALNGELEREFGVRIGVRTGVNTGEVYAGDPSHGDPFATGDPVVVAQRLEAAAEPGEILVGEATMRLVRDAVVAEPVPALSLKGKGAVDAWRLVDVDPDASGIARRLDSPLVGREAELAELTAELGRAISDRACRVVTILGEPGVGKSRLAAELAARAGDALVLEGRCLPYGNGVTYWPLVDVLRGLDLDALLAGPDGALVHGRLLEAVGRAEPRSRSDELFWAVRRLLETLAAERPVLLVLDDVQWAEPVFLDLIEYLSGWSREAAILVVCLARPDLAELRPAWAGTAIQLEPLARAEARVLLENLAGPLDADAADAIGRATGGNPLFLEEMLSMLVEDGVLVQRDGALVAAASVDSVRVPETVQAVLAARLDRLAADELAVLQRAAVIGQVFWWGAVADLTPVAETAEVPALLQALVRKGLVRPDRRTFAGEDGFRFGHILIRDAAYDSTPKRLRAELHERFAGWVEERAEDGEFDELLGHHLEQSWRYRRELGPPGEHDRTIAARAAERLARAGRRALTREDRHAAVSLLDRAAALLPEGSVDGPALALDRATALHRAGEIQAALALVEQLLAAGPPPRVEASAWLERAFIRISSGDGPPDEVLSAAERSSAVFSELDDDAGLAQVWNSVATELFWRGKLRQMEAASRHGLEHARRAGDHRQELWALNGLAIALAYGPTEAETAAEGCQELLDRARQLGGANLPRFALAAIEAMLGRFDAAWALYDEAKESDARPGLLMYAEPLLVLAPERGEAELRENYRTLEQLGEVSALPTAAAMLSEVLLLAGRLEEAEELTRVAERTAVRLDAYTNVVWRRVRARVRAGDQARELVREAVDLARQTDSSLLLAGALEAAAAVEESAGRRGDAERAEALALYRAKGNTAAAAALDVHAQTR